MPDAPLPVVRPLVTKEDAPCCHARALADGRPVIGFCSDECIRRPSAAPHATP